MERSNQINSRRQQQNSTYNQEDARLDNGVDYLRRLTIDAASGLIAGAAVAPVVVILDTAVTEAAFGHRALLPSLKTSLWSMLSQPHRMVVTRPFKAMLFLYGGTYLTANTCDSVASVVYDRPVTSHDSSLAKLGIVSGVNMSLSLYKENTFATTFGTATATARALPWASYFPFVLRDAITIFASFNMPHLLVSRLPESWEERLWCSRLSMAQLFAPAASQIVVTPLHLLGLDLYHRQGHLPWRQRWVAMCRGWPSSSVARMMRVIPGLAFGNVINTKLRIQWLESR